MNKERNPVTFGAIFHSEAKYSDEAKKNMMPL
jgi:hypothetical protein